MKYPDLRLTLVLLAACAAASVRAEPELVGVLTSNGTTHLAIRADATGGATWMGIGDRVSGYRITSYDAKNESLLLRRGDGEIRIKLKQAAVQSAPTLALLESLANQGDIGLKDGLDQLRALEARRSKAAAELAEMESRLRPGETGGDAVVQLRRRLRIEEGNIDYFLQHLLDAAGTKASKAP